jgi:UDP-2,4-diacetamido-2,4,6-trideoxy-beta-L-altropyranose hydrolase
VSAEKSAITLRPATPSDRDMIFRWRNDPFIRARGSSHREIGWEEHVNWFDETILGSTRKMFIGVDQGNPIGQIRFDRENQQDCVVSVYLLQAFTGRGLGVQLIRRGCSEIFQAWDVERVIACVRLDNQSGHSAFSKAGFQESDVAVGCPARHYSLILWRASLVS